MLADISTRTRCTRTHFHCKLFPNSRTYLRKGGRLDGSPVTRTSLWRSSSGAAAASPNSSASQLGGQAGGGETVGGAGVAGSTGGPPGAANLAGAIRCHNGSRLTIRTLCIVNGRGRAAAGGAASGGSGDGAESSRATGDGAESSTPTCDSAEPSAATDDGAGPSAATSDGAESSTATADGAEPCVSPFVAQPGGSVGHHIGAAGSQHREPVSGAPGSAASVPHRDAACST